MLSNSALLVLDMIDVYIWGEKPLVPLDSRKQLIKNIKKTISFAYKKKIPVIYITSSFSNEDPIYRMYINYREQAEDQLNNNQIIKELKPNKEDYVLTKRGFDGFWKSGLEQLLNKLKIKKIYLTGIQTDACVRETAVTAAHLGYEVFIIEDCVDTSREFGQVAALRFLKMCTRGIFRIKQIKTSLK